MDDFILMDENKEKLEKALDVIVKKLKDEYKLNVNPKKTNIVNIKDGFSFLGYTYKLSDKIVIRVNNATYRRVSKHLSSLVKYDVEMFKRSVISYKGFFSRCN